MLQTFNRRILQRKLSPYIVYTLENREKVKEGLPAGAAPQEVMKALGESWKNLSDTEKQKYAQQEIMPKPKKEVSSSNAMLKAARKNIDPNEPVAPMKAFALFYESFPSIREGPYADARARLQAARQAFSGLSEDEKKEYLMKEQRLQLQYEKDMKNFTPEAGKITRAQYQALLREVNGPLSSSSKFKAGLTLYRRELAQLKGCKVSDLKSSEVTAGWSKLNDTEKAIYEGRAEEKKK